jgi:hypothetical protein
MSEPRFGLTDFNHIPSSKNGVGQDRESWLPIVLTDLPAKPPVQPTLGQLHSNIGLIYPGMRHVFSGPPESAKTLVAYLILIQVVRDGGTSVLIDFEMGAYASRDRLRELGAEDDDLERIMFVSPDQPATTDRISLIIGLAPNLVCVDASAGVYDLEALDDNSRKDVGRIYRTYVLPFWEEGIATLFVDHVTKNTETRGNFAIGSERKIGTADIHLGFETITPISRGHRGLYKIHTRKDRGGYLKRGVLAEVELTSDPDTHQITHELRPAEEVPEGKVWVPSKQMQKASLYLEQQSEPITKNTLTAEIGGRKDYALKAISELVRMGYATETPGPNRSKLIQHHHSFTVYEWENQPDPPVVPSGSQVVPGTSQSGGSHPSPPYGGRNHPDNGKNHPVVPDYGSWIDDLEPSSKEDTPADLFDQPNDGIPF